MDINIAPHVLEIMDTPKRFVNHLILALRWLESNGKKGTEKQALCVMQQFDTETLRRMLTERGVKCE